ncbi:unnamed protein product [Brassica rapa]|uniref:Uncharacterized protein n=2 Tax=Brassica campestris TaxID=3711 RepID=A0A8D9M7W7_BRACM|nr:unnamed protein product [Brassica rapa]
MTTCKNCFCYSFGSYLYVIRFMQSLFPGNSLFKGKWPKQEDQYEFVSNSGKRSIKRRVNFGFGSNRKVKRKKVQGGPNRFVAGMSNVAGIELNQQDPGRGKMTVRKISERNDEDSYCLVRRTSDIVRPRSKEVEEEQTYELGQVKLLREMDEEWASETPNRVMTPMQVDDESDNSAVGVESEDDGDGQFVDYGQRNK